MGFSDEGIRMEREELVRLAGEQALLREERKGLAAGFDRDKQALLSLYNRINSGAGTRNWLADGRALLERLDTAQGELAELDRRLGELARLTGI